MAQYVVPPSVKMVKCRKCGTMYKPEKIKENGKYENCPTCHFCHNGKKDHVPLWLYKLIRYKREKLNL